MTFEGRVKMGVGGDLHILSLIICPVNPSTSLRPHIHPLSCIHTLPFQTFIQSCRDSCPIQAEVSSLPLLCLGCQALPRATVLGMSDLEANV